MELPLLAFGNDDAPLAAGVDESNEQFARVLPSVKLTPSTPEMFSRTVVCKIGATTMMTQASTAGSVAVEDSKGWHLTMPTFGEAVMRSEGQEVSFGASSGGLLLPNMRRVTQSGTRSLVIARIDIAQLAATGAAMEAGDAETLKLDEKIHLLSPALFSGLMPTFMKLCGVIDGTRGDDRLASLLGIEDMIYRWLALALGWAGKDAHSASLNARTPGKLDLVCDMIHSSFARALTMTELERISGLSSRALQYAFRARFGCTPMEWQRRERMAMAQQQLIALGPDGSITDLAYAMAFSSSSAFATLYKRHFGETPSETKARIFGPLTA